MPTGRRVETETAPLEVDGKVHVEADRRPDDVQGHKLVEQYGAPPRTTSVTRRVYAPDGTLMYDTNWGSYYVGEPTVVRIGTKPRPKPKKPVGRGGTTAAKKAAATPVTEPAPTPQP